MDGEIVGRTGKIMEHLCVYLETKCSGNFLESMKVTLMRTPASAAYRFSSGHHL